MISEKYSIGIDNSGNMITPNSKNEESKNSSSNSKHQKRKGKSEKFDYNGNDKNSMGKNLLIEKQKIIYNSLIKPREYEKDAIVESLKIISKSSPDDGSKGPNGRVRSIENNNLDLKSIRSKSNKSSDPKNGAEDSLGKEEYKHELMFTSVSQDNRKLPNEVLSNTLDVASIAKLRRMFGSERLLKECKTSEATSNLPYSISESDLNFYEDRFRESSMRKEIIKEDLLVDPDLRLNMDLEKNQIPINLALSPDKDESNDDRTQEFMATNELIDLFTSEGINKVTLENENLSDEKGQTLTLFEKNPFRDFTMTKIQEVLQNKEFDEIQEMRKAAIDYRATIEKKLLKK